MLDAHFDNRGDLHLNFSEQGVEEIYDTSDLEPATLQRDIDYYLNMPSEDEQSLQDWLDRTDEVMQDYLDNQEL